MMLGQTFKEQLERLQFSDHEKVILIDQLPTGYGGQLSRRLLGLKIGLALGRKAVFSCDGDVPYIQTVVRPFSWTGDLHIAEVSPLVEMSGSDPRALVRFDYFFFQKQLRRHGLNVEEWVEGLLADKFQLTRDDLLKLDGRLISWLRFVPDFEEKLKLDIERLDVSRNILGAHIRRGDKRVETAYVSTERINAAINSVYSVWKFEGVFIATDSADAVSDLRLPPGVGSCV